MFEKSEAHRGKVESRATKPREGVVGTGGSSPAGVYWSEGAAGSELPALVIVTSQSNNADAFVSGINRSLTEM